MGKILSEVFGSALSMASTLLETLICPGRCPFTGLFMVMMLFEKSTSIQRNLRASVGSAYVSFRV
jgi:hypothetical protein